MTNALKGRIQITRLNLMGFTPTTQVYIVQSMISSDIIGGYNNSITFLKSIAKYLDLTSDGYAIRAPRPAKFREYVAANGFELVTNS